MELELCHSLTEKAIHVGQKIKIQGPEGSLKRK